jgi:hypothetical protein
MVILIDSAWLRHQPRHRRADQRRELSPEGQVTRGVMAKPKQTS